MLYYWQADFESGNLADYFDTYNECDITAPSWDGSKYFRINSYPHVGDAYKNISEVSELWAQFRFRFSDNLFHDNYVVTFMHDGEYVLSLKMLTSNLWRITRGTWGAETELQTTLYVPHVASVWGKIDIHAKISDANGVFEVSLNDSPILNFVGDTLANPVHHAINGIYSSCFWFDNYNYDNITVADEPIRPPIFVSFM
jgi:hypothetical protein